MLSISSIHAFLSGEAIFHGLRLDGPTGEVSVIRGLTRAGSLALWYADLRRPL